MGQKLNKCLTLVSFTNNERNELSNCIYSIEPISKFVALTFNQQINNGQLNAQDNMTNGWTKRNTY